MSKNVKKCTQSQQNRDKFIYEMKLQINRQLFEKKLISESVYHAAKDLLLKQAG